MAVNQQKVTTYEYCNGEVLLQSFKPQLSVFFYSAEEQGCVWRASGVSISFCQPVLTCNTCGPSSLGRRFERELARFFTMVLSTIDIRFYAESLV